jgi:hypothetical protein
MATGFWSVRQTKHKNIIKVDARFLDFFYISNVFTDDPFVILDSSTEYDSKSDVDYKPSQKRQKADHALYRMQGKRYSATKEKG